MIKAIARSAAAAVAAGALALGAAGTAGAAVPHPLLTAGCTTFGSADGHFLAAVGSPQKVGSDDLLNCRVQSGVSPQNSFVLVPLSSTMFAIQWADGDGRALVQHLYVSGVGGPAQFAGFSHVIDAASTWHQSGGQVVNGNGLALDLLAGHGAAAVPAGGSQPGAQLVLVS